MAATFPTTAVVDTFQYPDQSPNPVTAQPSGLTWSGTKISSGDAGLLLISGHKAAGQTLNSSENIVGSYANCEVWTTIATYGSSSTMELWARASTPSSLTGYQLAVDVGAVVWNVRRFSAGVGVTLVGNTSSVPFTPTAGDAWGMRVLGDNPVTVEIWMKPPGGNWTPLGVGISTVVPIASGYFGVRLRNSLYSLSDFGGGTPGNNDSTLTPLSVSAQLT